jgi:hypothetical protein
VRKLICVGLAIVLLTMLTACNQDSDSGNMPKMVDVKLSVKPEKGKVGQPVTFEAKVTQGKKGVDDADEVVFEIWRSKAENHDKFTIKHPNNGIYSLKKTFQEEGTYYIVSHVTARGMHNMPKKEFIIGMPSEKEDPNASGSMDGMKMDDKKSENNGH